MYSHIPITLSFVLVILLVWYGLFEFLAKPLWLRPILINGRWRIQAKFPWYFLGLKTLLHYDLLGDCDFDTKQEAQQLATKLCEENTYGKGVRVLTN